MKAFNAFRLLETDIIGNYGKLSYVIEVYEPRGARAYILLDRYRLFYTARFLTVAQAEKWAIQMIHNQEYRLFTINPNKRNYSYAK